MSLLDKVHIRVGRQRGLHGKGGALLHKLCDARDHQLAGLYGHPLRVEGRQTACYLIGIDILVALHKLRQDSEAGSRLARPVASRNDIHLLSHGIPS